MRSMRRGFTLIELLVVVAIIATLASLLMPTLSQAKEKGRQVTCTSNQRQLYLTISMWAQDHDERYPDGASVWKDVDFDAKILRCPTQEALGIRKDDEAAPEEATNDYAYSSFISEKSLAAVKDPVEEILTLDNAGLRIIKEGGRPAVSGLRTISQPTIPSKPNIFISPADIAFRHSGASLTSYCDGHVALLREPPPFWLIEVTNFAFFQQEALRSIYPVILVFKKGEHIPATMVHQVYPDDAILPFAKPVMVKTAKMCRGRVKIIMVNYKEYALLAEAYGLDGGPDIDYDYLAMIFLRNGRECDRIFTGLSGIHVDPSKSAEQMISNNLAKVTKFLND